MSKTQIVTGGIADDAVSEEHLDATALTGNTALAETPADTDELLVSDAGTLKRIDFSHIKGLMQSSVGGNIVANGNNLFEEVTSSAGMPSSGGNKSVDTTYDSSFDVTAGKWLITVNLDVAIFENHGNSNSTGVYLGSINIGSSAGDSTYGSFSKILPKWGNGTNSYSDTTGAVLGFQTFSSTTTVHTRWAVYEYGGSSNYWVRGNNTKIRFIRVG